MDVNDLHASADAPDAAAPAPQPSASAAAPAQAPTLEAEVSALVGSLGSWWSGVSKKSAEQLASAREQINAQGGILALARSEAAKFEAQLSAAQASAREAAQTPLDSTAGQGSKGKGKGKASDDEEWLGDSRREKEGEYSEEGEALPLSPEERGLLRQQSDLHDKASQSELDDIANAGRAALGSAQAWFSSLAEDKRLKELQTSLSSTIASFSNTSAPPGDGEQTQAGQRQVLPSLVSSIQASLPHLDLKQSEALAKRYWDQSQMLAKDVGVEVKAMMGDLVKVVPPPDADGKHPAAASASRSSGEASDAAKPTAASVPMSAGTSTTEASTADSEDFEWDTDAEHASRLDRAAAPGPVVSEAPQRTALPSAAAGDAEKPAPTTGRKDDEADSGDSDWE